MSFSEQRAGIEEVERAKGAAGPLAAFLEFDAGEVADVAVAGVADASGEDAVLVGDADEGVDGDLGIELEADAGRRDVLEVGDGAAGAPGAVGP